MSLIFAIVLCFLIIAAIAYPLFVSEIRDYESSKLASGDFNEPDALLSAIGELETDYELGRLSNADYERLKLQFQRQYLQEKKLKATS